jgi:hypothetical protein
MEEGAGFVAPLRRTPRARKARRNARRGRNARSWEDRGSTIRKGDARAGKSAAPTIRRSGMVKDPPCLLFSSIVPADIPKAVNVALFPLGL